MQTADGIAIAHIEDEAALTTLRGEIAACSHVAIDTEFMRTNTFYPVLGLIQLADARGCYLVDPIPMRDHSEISALLAHPSQSFVIHSCSEDLNLLHTSLKVLPTRIFDTQLAAAFLGLGFSLSYQALVRDMFGVDIPKDETRSDWIKRPLSDTQKVYAATDVCYLLQLREALEVQLRERGSFDWFEQECAEQLSIAQGIEQESNWVNAYTNISNAWRLSDAALVHLQRLGVWREATARRRNKPRSWVAKDNDLTLIAAQLEKMPQLTLADLKDMPQLDPQVASRYGQDLLRYLEGEPRFDVAIDRELLNVPLAIGSRKHMKACQQVVQRLAAELGMAPELLGRKKLLIELIRNFERTGTLLWPESAPEWRKTVLGPEFQRVLTA